MPAGSQNLIARQRCIDPDCAREFSVSDVLVSCPSCGSLLDVVYDWDRAWPGDDPGRPRDFSVFEARSLTQGPRASTGSTDPGTSALDFSGVWRFRDLLPFYGDERAIVTLGEGRTSLQRTDALAGEVGLDPGAGGRLYLQYEGFNPSGSFKDNGMAAAFTHARMVDARRVACASTGNTSASLAMYGALTGIPALVLIGEGKIAMGKLSQALEYGARTLQIAGDFDACLRRVREIAQRPELGVYLMNSVNPFRLEGQKTIMLRILEGLDWNVPDWIVCPGGNLGNSSAFGKAFLELRELGLIDRLPRLAVINAQGARTLDRVYNELGVRWNGGRYDKQIVADEFRRMDEQNERASTVASAIEINRPVNLPKCLRALDAMAGVVRSVDDRTILDHKALVGRYGFGCEPASGASVAGVRALVEEGVIEPGATVACVLTGHLLKDPDATVGYHTGAGAGSLANVPVRVADDLDAIVGEL